MAAYAAHLTRTLHGAPSLFQVAAQDALGATVKLALKKLVEYLAAVYPYKYGWLLRWFDEAFLLFDCCLQYHYLKHYAASFSESFYGLTRSPLSHAASREFATARLPPTLERLSLAALTLVPYARDKIEAAVGRWRDDDDDGRLGKSPSDRLRRAAIRVHSIAHVCTSLASLAQLCRYASGRSRAPTLPLYALGLTLKDAPPPTIEPDDHSWSDFATALLRGNLTSCVVTFPMVGALCLRVVEHGAFAVQFLRWWESRGTRDTPLPAPPPPQRDERGVKFANKCPLCLQKWKTPTALPVSGYIFCYMCISRHVRASGACPVTRLPASERSLVRLYVDVDQ